LEPCEFQDALFLGWQPRFSCLNSLYPPIYLPVTLTVKVYQASLTFVNKKALHSVQGLLKLRQRPIKQAVWGSLLVADPIKNLL
jgi:hypothetical protein